MGTNTKIEWCDHTFNPWIGCAKVSAGCKFCYAEAMMDKRWGKVEWGVNGTRKRTSDANWRKPLAWNRDAEAKGIRYRVFCASLADVFEEREEVRSWRLDLFNIILQTPHLDWLLLTKRPETIKKLITLALRDANNQEYDDLRYWLYEWLITECPPNNVWLGTSVENQAEANTRIPHLLNVPAKVRFLSCEPLLGPLNFTLSGVDVAGWDEDLRYDTLAGRSWTSPRTVVLHDEKERIHWVIAGGESGNKARPMHPGWARSIRDQCVEADVQFFFKQWGRWIHEDQVWEDATVQHTPYAYWGARHIEKHWDFEDLFNRGLLLQDEQAKFLAPLGKKITGRVLDGKTWSQIPEPLVEVSHAD